MQHRFMLLAVSTVGLWVALGLMAPTLAQSDDILSRSKAAIINDRAELASANRGSPRASLSAFLSQRGIGRSTIDSVVETARHTDALGREFARFEQRIDGLRVHGAYARVAFDAQGNWCILSNGLRRLVASFCGPAWTTQRRSVSPSH
jgi:Zn-dependent metalloprotease